MASDSVRRYKAVCWGGFVSFRTYTVKTKSKPEEFVATKAKLQLKSRLWSLFLYSEDTNLGDTEMNAAKVMPVDLAMHMCLNCHPPVRQLLEMATLKSHRAVYKPSMCESQRSRALRSPQVASSLRALNCKSSLKCTNPSGLHKKKKRVVFADAKGLALTAVRIFKSDPPISDVEEFSPPVKVQSESSVPRKLLRLRLGFPQPSADLPSFLESLKKSLVRLESCSLRYGSLFGKVRVCNISPEKAVHVRITCDSWRSHQDIPCTPIQQKNEGSETELFLFNVPIPYCANLQDRLEFCVSFRPGSGNTLLLDSNDGRNYRIFVENVTSEEAYLVEKKHLRPQNFQSPQSLLLKKIFKS